jgi:pyridoxal/pyridoxine/pyridoxamine kinase
MNTAELSNISGSDRFEIKREVDSLGSLSSSNELQAVIVKEENRHVLINFVDGVPYYRDMGGGIITEYWHKKLGRFDIKNDTGTGDAFAGGVIAGILSPTTLSYNRVPVDIGSSLARSVLQSYDFPSNSLNNVSRETITKRQKEAAPSDKWEMKINAIRANHGEKIEGLLIGVAASGLVYVATLAL